MIKILAAWIARNKYIRGTIENPTDLSEFREKPTLRLILGLVLMGFSYILGWPSVAALGVIAIWLEEPLIAAIGGPAVYGLSHLVFLGGALLARAPHYMGVLVRYSVGKLFRKLLA
jgi:hypothetical protein